MIRRKAPATDLRRRVSVFCACLGLAACGAPQSPSPTGGGAHVLGGGTAEAASPSEAKVLARLGELPPAQETMIGELVVVADAPYHAASGKTCRRVLLTSKADPRVSRARLACRKAAGWGFVPSVLLSPPEQ